MVRNSPSTGQSVFSIEDITLTFSDSTSNSDSDSHMHINRISCFSRPSLIQPPHSSSWHPRDEWGSHHPLHTRGGCVYMVTILFWQHTVPLLFDSKLGPIVLAAVQRRCSLGLGVDQRWGTCLGCTWPTFRSPAQCTQGAVFFLRLRKHWRSSPSPPVLGGGLAPTWPSALWTSVALVKEVMERKDNSPKAEEIIRLEKKRLDQEVGRGRAEQGSDGKKRRKLSQFQHCWKMGKLLPHIDPLKAPAFQHFYRTLCSYLSMAEAASLYYMNSLLHNQIPSVATSELVFNICAFWS